MPLHQIQKPRLCGAFCIWWLEADEKHRCGSTDCGSNLQRAPWREATQKPETWLETLL